jgi:hypothetical protein
MAKVKGTKEFPVVLVANQSTDLPPSLSHYRVLCVLCVSRPPIELIAAEGEEAGWEITSKEGRSIAYTYRCPFVEASAKTGLGVDSIFSNIVKEIKGRRPLPFFPLSCAAWSLPIARVYLFYRLKNAAR